MRVFILAVTLSFFSFTAFGQTANSEVLIGVVPNMSARLISTHYQPMADYFEKILQFLDGNLSNKPKVPWS